MFIHLLPNLGIGFLIWAAHNFINKRDVRKAYDRGHSKGFMTAKFEDVKKLELDLSEVTMLPLSQYVKDELSLDYCIVIAVKDNRFILGHTPMDDLQMHKACSVSTALLLKKWM